MKIHIYGDSYEWLCGRVRTCNTDYLRTDEQIQKQATVDVRRICLPCWVKYGIEKAQTAKTARAICGEVVE